MNALESKIKFSTEWKEVFTIVEVNNFTVAYIEETCLSDEVVTYFYWKDSGNRITGQKVFRKFRSDKKGKYIHYHGYKVHFEF